VVAIAYICPASFTKAVEMIETSLTVPSCVRRRVRYQKGGFDFITKPFRKEQILFTIDRAMKWLKVQRENRMLKEQLKKSES
jgi:FixJ family two-component response regulator